MIFDKAFTCLLCLKVFIDTVGPPGSYLKKLSMKFPSVEFVVSTKADSIYAVVAAASICAKVTRDALLKNWSFKERISFSSKEMGSGYPADPVTRQFLKRCFNPLFGFPSIVRFSWSTVQEILDARGIEMSGRGFMVFYHLQRMGAKQRHFVLSNKLTFKHNRIYLIT
ncbi:unnamed protein product [Soboliphyme baturini]|uniref:Ribonuclease n=1 Tax=Soboliphyme baturini TaxID=241478 RepID=A0A183IXB1_9BILA|nr:unnamed protein product [Soboliphyme baturini]